MLRTDLNIGTEAFLNAVRLDLSKEFHEHDSERTFCATGFESVVGYSPVVFSVSENCMRLTSQ